MVRKLAVVSPLLISAALFLSGCAEPPGPLLEASSRTDGIVNGTRTPQSTYLTEGEILAIGYLADRRGSPFCTGTLVNDTTVVTAQHCTEGSRAADIRFGIGLMPSSPVALLGVARILEHPSIDFAVLILSSSAIAAAPALTPIALNREAMSSAWVGRWVDASGFGDTYSSATGRFFAAVQLENYDSETVTVNGHGEQGICYGDSGGPILWQPSGDVAPVIVGTEQWGDDSCVGRDHLTRVDVVASWVDAQLSADPGPDPDPPAACGEVDYLGLCDGETAIWCAETGLAELDCGATNQRCGWLGPELGHYCLPATCGGTDYFGSCSGTVLSWCSGEGLRTVDCGDDAEYCGWIGAEVGYNCTTEDCFRCDGACTDVQSSLVHCGSCGSPCAPQNGVGACSAGICTLVTCSAGWSDGDGDPANGCEAAVSTDPGTTTWTRRRKTESSSGCGATHASGLAVMLAPLLLVARRGRGSATARRRP